MKHEPDAQQKNEKETGEIFYINLTDLLIYKSYDPINQNQKKEGKKCKNKKKKRQQANTMHTHHTHTHNLMRTIMDLI